jgi:hypothetical protein
MAPLPRHERLPDLLAASEDPHPRKTRRIKFVGDFVPADNDLIMAKVMLSEALMVQGKPGAPYTETMVKAVRWANATALKPISGCLIRVFEHDDQLSMAPQAHLSRTYQWRGENDFTCDVDYRDVDVILGGADGHQFRDITDQDPDEPTVILPSPEVFKLIAIEAVPTMALRGEGPQRGDVVAAH